MRISVGVFVALAVGCSAKPLDTARARQALMAHADQLRQAMLQDDYGRVVDLSPDVLVDGFGGRERYIERIEKVHADFKDKGMGISGLDFSEPSELVESRGAVHAVVPFDLRMTGLDGAKTVKPSYLVAVSTDRGVRWKFIDGAGIAGDRAKLRRILPSFPDRLSLPEVQPQRWED